MTLSECLRELQRAGYRTVVRLDGAEVGLAEYLRTVHADGPSVRVQPWSWQCTVVANEADGSILCEVLRRPPRGVPRR